MCYRVLSHRQPCYIQNQSLGFHRDTPLASSLLPPKARASAESHQEVGICLLEQ